jgi:hypothetical protein
MTGITAATGPAVETGGPGIRPIIAGFMIDGTATDGTVEGTSGPHTAMTGITAAIRTVAETGGPGIPPITAGFMIDGTATSGTAGECVPQKYPMIHRLWA